VKSKGGTELFLELHIKPSFLCGRIGGVCKNKESGLILVSAKALNGGIRFVGFPPSLS